MGGNIGSDHARAVRPANQYSFLEAKFSDDSVNIIAPERRVGVGVYLLGRI
jgi:hypothetical protein